MKRLLLIISFFIPFAADAQKEFQKKFQTAFIEVEDGGRIELPEGRFSLEVSLWLDDKKNVTIRGKGMAKTILNFKDQISGAEGIKITHAENIVVTDLTVQDTKGDGVKAQQVTGFVLRNVKAEWTRGAQEDAADAPYPLSRWNVELPDLERFLAHGP